jgi:hypothetical protein
MPTKSKDDAGTKNSKQRTQVKDLPREEKELSRAEQKELKGGIGAYGLIISSAKPQNQPQ